MVAALVKKVVDGNREVEWNTLRINVELAN